MNFFQLSMVVNSHTCICNRLRSSDFVGNFQTRHSTNRPITMCIVFTVSTKLLNDTKFVRIGKTLYFSLRVKSNFVNLLPV